MTFQSRLTEPIVVVDPPEGGAVPGGPVLQRGISLRHRGDHGQRGVHCVQVDWRLEASVLRAGRKVYEPLVLV